MKFHLLFVLIALSIFHDCRCSDTADTIFQGLRALFFNGEYNLKSDNRASSNADCSIDIRTELNRTAGGTVKEPLFLKYSGNEYKFMIPDDDGLLKFKGGESALIACTSDQKPNTLTLSE